MGALFLSLYLTILDIKIIFSLVSNLKKILNLNSNSNWTFIALNLPKQEDSKMQQNKKQSTNFCIQGHKRGQAP